MSARTPCILARPYANCIPKSWPATFGMQFLNYCCPVKVDNDLNPRMRKPGKPLPKRAWQSYAKLSLCNLGSGSPCTNFQPFLAMWQERAESLCKVSAEHQACLNVMPNRSQGYAKLVQGERSTSSLLECYAEPQPRLCKAQPNPTEAGLRRAQCK